MAFVLATVRLQQVTALPKDVVQNNFAFLTADPFIDANAATITLALQNFYDVAPPGGVGLSISSFMSSVIDRGADAHEVRFYDLGAGVDGRPHGGPKFTKPLSIVTAPGAAQNLPNQDACVLSIRNPNWGHAGPPVAELAPTDDRAQDEGAPATHPATSRPNQRVAGRLYLGPWNIGASTNATNKEPRVTPSLAFTIAKAAAKLIVDVGVPLAWAIWSRRESGFSTVDHGFIDDRWDAQRRRESPAVGRVLWP